MVRECLVHAWLLFFGNIFFFTGFMTCMLWPDTLVYSHAHL